MEQLKNLQQAVKDALEDSGIYGLKHKLKSMSITEQFPGLSETIEKAAEVQESLAYSQPPRLMNLGPLHNDEAERK